MRCSRTRFERGEASAERAAECIDQQWSGIGDICLCKSAVCSCVPELCYS